MHALRLIPADLWLQQFGRAPRIEPPSAGPEMIRLDVVLAVRTNAYMDATDVPHDCAASSSPVIVGAL